MQIFSEEEIMSNLREEDIDIDSPHYFYKEAPLQLIDFINGNFCLNEEALNMIRSIEEEIIIVSIVGKARTGKSYLMNLLLDQSGKGGFDTASSIASCTKGIWLWGSYRKNHTGNAKIIFIDSEGTSSVDRSTKTYDSKIFALVVLISSLFIYNSTSNIDENSIAELSLAAHLSTSIACNTSIDKENLIADLAPKFVWVLRDFTLEKVHHDTGEAISSNEYMELCLRKKISGKNSMENNLIRENILKYFRYRECITLPRPAETENELRNLKNMKLEELKSSFKYEFMNLKNKVYRDAFPKRINGKKMNGVAIANLLKEFVDAINNGVVPNINSAWDVVIEQDIKSVYDKAFNKFKELTKKIEKKSLTHSDLLFSLRDNKLKAFLIYDNLTNTIPEINTNNFYLKLFEENKSKLKEEITKLEEKIIKEDDVIKKKNNTDILKVEYKTILNKLLENSYKSEDNYHDLISDYLTVIKCYDHKADGPEKLKTLSDFINNNNKELLYYIVTNTNNEFKLKHNEYKQKVFEIQTELKDLNESGLKLKQINSVLQNRVNHLENDKNKKNKEIEFMKDRYENLLIQRGLLFGQQTIEKSNFDEDIFRPSRVKAENITQEQQNVKFDTNPGTGEREECQCVCNIF